MATLDDARPGAAPWLLSGPALLLFVGLLLVPLILTLTLSFRVFSDTAGVTSAYTLSNYWEVVSDPYYGTIFLRTAGLAFGVTLLSIVLGVPETIILARMKKPWQSLCLLIVLGPLLISVVVRTLGWALLLGNNGVLNNVLQVLHITDEPVRLVFTMTGMIIALTHVLVPFMVMSVWATLQRLDPQVEWARPLARRIARSRCFAASCCRRSCRACSPARSSCSRSRPPALRDARASSADGA